VCSYITEFGIIIAILLILLCLFVVLVERKFLAHAQRRFGPSIAGRNGWLQIILDLVKLATKESFILSNPLTSLTPTLIALFFTVQLLFIQNFVFGPSLFFFYNIDGLIFYHLILVMLSNIVLILIGFLTQSKYTLLGVFRAVVHVVSMDIYVTLVYILIIMNANSGQFHDYSLFQLSVWSLFLYAPCAFLFLILMLLESKRAPFDHVETESEVVAGYATEFSGIYLLTFYLVEYFHLIISANHFVIFFMGGWFYMNFMSLLTASVLPLTHSLFFF
jgi:NADH-quinone oxidoreductase subunit H